MLKQRMAGVAPWVPEWCNLLFNKNVLFKFNDSQVERKKIKKKKKASR